MQIPKRLKRAGRRCAAVASVLLTGVVVTVGLIAVPFLLLTAPVDDYALTALEPASQRTLVLHGNDGKPFARRGGCVAESVSLDEVPQHFIDALLSMEDRRFYYHLGIDPIGLARAAMENRAAGRIVQGGSTITQQLVKYSLLSSDRTMERKQKEAWLALSLELRLSKEEILERYLSSTYFGQGCYGLRAAAKRYFGTTVPKLTIPQSAYLVALLKSPTALNRTPEAARQRGDAVLNAMVSNRKLDADIRESIEPIVPEVESGYDTGGYYADWVASTLEVPRTGNYSPLPVQTAFDPVLQGLAEKAVEAVLAKEGKARKATQAAMVVMRPDGRVLAMVGGVDHDESQFNRAVQARRQPGSSFKLFVYLAALRAGLTPNSMVVDRPVRIGSYEPENFGHRYRGAMPMRSAFASSINTVAVQLSEAMGRKPVINAARDLGISTPLEPQPSLALGAFEVTLLEMTSAYAAVAAGAYPVKPWAITGFEETDSNAAPPREAGRWRLNEKSELQTLLRGTVERGSGRRARLPVRAYGKTGTSQDYKDAWFIGFAGNLVAGVWVGNDDSSKMNRVTGGSLPAEIWAAFMRDAIKQDPAFEPTPKRIAAFIAEPHEPDVKIAKNVFQWKGRKAKRRKTRKVRRVEDPRLFQDRRQRPRRERRGLFGGLFR